MERRLPVPQAPKLEVGEILGQNFDVQENTLRTRQHTDHSNPWADSFEVAGYLTIEIPIQLRACSWQFIFDALEAKANEEIRHLGFTVYKWSIVMVTHHLFEMAPKDWEVSR